MVIAWLSAADCWVLKVKLLIDVQWKGYGRSWLWLEVRRRCLSVGSDEIGTSCYVEQPGVPRRNKPYGCIVTDILNCSVVEESLLLTI